jgi:hypothetical protein
MKIDKTRFLLATGVVTVSMGLLAAVTAGCSSKSEDAAPAAHDEDAKAPVTDPTQTDPSTPGKDAGPKSTPDSGSNTDGGSNKDGGDGGTTVACLDDKSPAAQPACPGAGECQDACDTFATDYKKGLSADIRKCLTVAICQTSTATCADKALAKACVDATATTFCTPLVAGCKGSNPADTITQASCEALAKGLTAAGRDVLKTCFENEAVCGDCPAQMK